MQICHVQGDPMQPASMTLEGTWTQDRMYTCTKWPREWTQPSRRWACWRVPNQLANANTPNVHWWSGYPKKYRGVLWISLQYMCVHVCIYVHQTYCSPSLYKHDARTLGMQQFNPSKRPGVQSWPLPRFVWEGGRFSKTWTFSGNFDDSESRVGGLCD